MNQPQQTAVHPAFEWLRSEEIPSLNIVMEEYRHRETGASHYHLSSDNEENVFLVALRTVPMDSTGVAHILEHTALCGSEKYPVRDPFFMMIRRSLNTFMNAFTSSDWTAYPFASKNRKDFFNLLSVYLDAVFFSRLDELDFAQEGHRLEFSEADNPDSALEFKGVVYNEMKGAMSSTNSVLWQSLSKYLFPTTTYHYNSGGDPADIPDLTYQQLKDFYTSHYHPSNAVFMTFGNIPAVELQQRFHELALSRFQKLDIDIRVLDEKRYLAPLRVEESYVAEAGATESKTHVVTAWLLGKSIDLTDLFRAQLLTSVLLDNSASPLLKVLETSDLGSSPSPMCGLEDNNREMSFLCGLEGCDEDSSRAVEKLILDTLHEVAANGVPQEQVEAALHQLELNQREISGDSYPYGLQLILAGLSCAIHRGDPIKLLNIDPVLEQLREEIRNPDFIPSLLRQFLLDNPHRLTLTLRPDAELAQRQVQAELSRLEALRNSLTAQDKAVIMTRAKALELRQQQQDDPGILPKVGLQDVPPTVHEPQRLASVLPLADGELPVSFYGQGTNGLVYQQIVSELPALEDGLLEALPYFTSCVTELGIGDKDYTQVQTWQSSVSGGLNAFSTIRGKLDDVQQTRGVMSLSSKALRRNHGALTDLLQQTLQHARLDEGQRIAEIIEQICARRENSITGQGHSLAMTLASSRMSPTAELHHRYGGLESIRRLKQLRDELGKRKSKGSNRALAQLLESFQALQDAFRSAPHQLLVIAEAEHQPALLQDLQQHWSSNPKLAGFTPLVLPPVRDTLRQVWTTATQVSFCAKAYPTVPSGHPEAAPLAVLAGFLRNGFLHRAIREKGGAYGGGADHDANSASFRFYSYRDPRLDETLDDFDRALDWVLENNHQPHQLEEAILGVISAMDKSTSPAGEAKRAFYNQLFDRSLEHLMQFRCQVLAVTLEDLQRVTRTWLRPEQASIGVITSRALLETSRLRQLETINL
ncbi:MAG: hypothetical protein RLZZ385_2052 [Pseudomonadota bacterium]